MRPIICAANEVYAVMPFQETSAAAKEAAQKAVTLDENLAEGYAALGFAVLMHDFDWAQAEKHLRRRTQPELCNGTNLALLLFGCQRRVGRSIETNLTRAQTRPAHTDCAAHFKFDFILRRTF